MPRIGFVEETQPRLVARARGDDKLSTDANVDAPNPTTTAPENASAPETLSNNSTTASADIEFDAIGSPDNNLNDNTSVAPDNGLDIVRDPEVASGVRQNAAELDDENTTHVTGLHGFTPDS
ncbi:hypothetical protein DVH05_015054 [Phytophthora capsici]|nr:hypothetical protein DVH05_015054 [Phytophthora capsici]